MAQPACPLVLHVIRRLRLALFVAFLSRRSQVTTNPSRAGWVGGRGNKERL